MISPKGSNSLGNSELIKPKSEFIEEIVLDDSGSEISEPREEELPIFTKEDTIPAEPAKTNAKKCVSLLKKNTSLRGLLPPKSHKSYLQVLGSPVIRRCCIEHSYFARNRSGTFRYNFRMLPVDASTTLQFGNKSPIEQPTVDIECLAPAVPANDSFNENNVNGQKKRNSCSSSTCSSASSRDSADDSNDRDYCPEGNSTGSDSESASVLSCESERRIRNAGSRQAVGNASDTDGKTGDVALGAGSGSSRFLRLLNSSSKVRKMQKVLKAKYVNEKGKSGKMSPPRIKKMMSQRKDDSILKMTEYLFSISNLAKTTNGEKNWRMEYMDDEVQNLGLDDLLLKASELNAENFTKALGRKLEPAKPNFNGKDNSEVVFTIPKSKKGAEEGCESDSELSKKVNVKTIKLDISKPFLEADKTKEGEPVAKPPEDTSPKRPGIKVKTVENINEEFKDSLGRLNGIDKEPPCAEKNGFGIVNESEREMNSQDESEKDAEGSRPFIMTIIQSKTEKQRPAILRNSYLKKKVALEKTKPQKTDCRIEDESPPGENPKKYEKVPEKEDLPGGNSQVLEKGASFASRDPCGDSCVDLETETSKGQEGESRFAVKQRNIPFILNHNKKARRAELSLNKSQSKLVKLTEPGEKPPAGEKTFKITSIEQKLGPKEANRRFIKVVPYEPITKHGLPGGKTPELHQKLSDDEVETSQRDGKTSHVLSLSAFSTILKEILPDKWFLCLDKKHGLQIIKTHMDEFLNPLILISVVITRCGRVTVNVRGKQLHRSHELFSNLCNMSNSENKLSLNYILGILNKLRHRSVCCGCDDPSLKKYWSDGGVVESQTEFQQVYRSHLCQLLVSLGRRRCYPCYRMNESIKKRYRRDKLKEKAKEEKEKESKGTVELAPHSVETPKQHPPARGVKRNLEDFLEESFSTMKQQIVDEIEKNRKLGERENALKAQEEVLSFMGLTRKESLDNPVRKSKRKKNSFYKLQQPVSKKIDQKELEFLEKYWSDINTLFSTSLLFGAYSRTGRGRLREKCRMFQKLLSTWKNIITTNPEWIGEISLPDDLIAGDSLPGTDSSADQFEKMDVPALRAYIINSVKEVNRIKHKLRTRNSYFKVLYNKFVKRRIKRPKSLAPSPQKGNGSSATSTTNTPTPTDFSSDENSRDKEKEKEKEKVGEEVTMGGEGEGMGEKEEERRGEGVGVGEEVAGDCMTERGEEGVSDKGEVHVDSFL